MSELPLFIVKFDHAALQEQLTKLPDTSPKKFEDPLDYWIYRIQNGLKANEPVLLNTGKVVPSTLEDPTTWPSGPCSIVSRQDFQIPSEVRTAAELTALLSLQKLLESMP